jgi:chloride channel 7
MATLTFNTEGGIIRQLLWLPVKIKESDGLDGLNTLTVLIFLVVWVFFTFTTYGIWVPSGLFLPGIIIGSCVGLLYMQLMLSLGLTIHEIGGQSYIILGASAMLTAYCRLTYSLAVVMLETT